MTQRRPFNKNYLQQEFDRLDAKTQPITLYLIGGGAMAFYGLKDWFSMIRDPISSYKLFNLGTSQRAQLAI